MSRKKILFSTEKYAYLAKEIIEHENELIIQAEESGEKKSNTGEFIEGIIERSVFPDDEVYHRIETNVDGADVILIGGTPKDADWTEVFDIACALAKFGSHTLTIVLPYISYSTMERSVKKGEINKAKTRLRMLSTIPKTNRNRFIFVDLHVDTLPQYIEGDSIAEELKCTELVKSAALEMCGTKFVLASADLGRAKEIRKLANDLGVKAAYVSKERKSGTDTEIDLIVGASVKGKKVVIYDDMIRTGGSLIKAGQAYRDAGAKEVYAIAIHGVFPKEAALRIANSGVFDYFATTNSHPNACFSSATEGVVEHLKIIPLAPMLYDRIIKL